MSRKVTRLAYDIQHDITDISIEQVIEFLQKYVGKNAIIKKEYIGYDGAYDLDIVVQETEKQYKARMAAEKAAKEKAKRDKDYQKYLELKELFESGGD